MAHVHTRGNDNFGKNKRFYMVLMDVGGRLRTVIWRRGRDSNPRYGCPYAAFRVRCFQPLSHLSAGRQVDKAMDERRAPYLAAVDS